MKPRRLSVARLSFALASALAALLSAPSASAATYYWDNNGTGTGFGTPAAGTWAAPTTGSAAQGWSTSTTGATLPGNITVLSTSATVDAVNFGNTTTGLGAGTITVSGTVQSGNITFASGSGSIVLSGGVINLTNAATGPTITVNNASAASTIGSNLTGGLGGATPSNVTKAGTGTLNLSGTNSYLSKTAVNGGVLLLTSANALPATGLNFGGGVLGLGFGDFTLPQGSTSNSANPGAFHFPGASGGWAAYGADRNVNIGGAGGFVGIGSGNAPGTLYSLNGKTLVLGAADATDKLIFVNGLDMGGGIRVIQVNDGPAAVDAEISGVIRAGTVGGGFNKTGTGTLLLSNANTFTGALTIDGKVIANGTEASSAGPLGSADSTRTITVNSGATLQLAQANALKALFSSSNVPSLVINGTVNDTNLSNPGNNPLGNVTLNNGTLSASVGNASGYGSYNLNGTVTSTGTSLISSSASVPITLSAAAGTTTTFDVQSGTLTASAALGQVTASGDERISNLTKIGGGTLVLAATNTYTGNTAINAGILNIATKDSLPGYNTNGRFSVASGATLVVQNGVLESEIGAMLGTTNFLSGANLGFDTTAGDRTVVANLTNTAQGPLGIVKLGANTLTLTGTNTYTGPTTVLAGALNISSTSSLPGWNVNGNFSLASGASLIVPNSVSEAEVTTLLGTTNVAAGASLLFDTSLGDRTYASAVTNSTQGLLNIAKIGANTLTLAGANTYSGTSTVTAGRLVLSGSTTTGGNLVIGNTTANAVLNIPVGGAMTAGTVSVGTTAASIGALHISGGSLSCATPETTDTISFGLGEGAYGAFTLSSGTFTQQRFMFGGTGTSVTGGTGVGLITGGTVNSTGWLILSRAGGSTGTLTITGGILNHAGAAQDIVVGLGSGTATTHTGRAELNVAGGLIDNTGRRVTFSAGTGGTFHWVGTGLVNLNGGTLLTNSFNYDALSPDASSYVNFSGGTLKAAASSATFLPAFTPAGTGINRVFVNGAFGAFSGGATIDTNGFNSTIPANLLAPTGNGVTGLSIDNAGSGYIGAPAVKILDNGLPSTATAYAVVDSDSSSPAFGKITSVVITNPGVIAGTATVSLVGGGGTGAAVSVASTGPNTSGGLTKTGAGTLTLTGANTYTGMTTVSGGSLTVSGTGSLATSSGLTVGSGATFNYLPPTVGTNLALSTLNLNDGSSIGLALDATTSNKITTSGAAVVGTGAGVGINLTGIPTLGTPYTILAAASGLDIGSYVLLNPTDYFGTINKSATAVTVTATSIATPLTAAYWKGGYTGFSGIWAVSNGLSGPTGLSNWTTDAAGTLNTAVVPGSGTNVFLSGAGAGAGDQNAMTLGANMVINSLTVNDVSSPNANSVTLLGTDGATLTLAAASGTGITVNAGSGPVTLASNVALGSSQTWNNNSTNDLTVSGTLSGAFGLTKAGTGLVNITGATAVTSATVDAGTLYMGAQTGPSITTILGAGSAVTLNGTSNLTLRRTNVGPGDLIGAIGGTGSLTLLGDNATTITASDFTLNNASTYSGGTTIIGARAAPTLGSALGSGPVTVGANGGIFVNAATQTFTNNFTIGGLGWNEPNGFLGAFRLNGTTISGAITLTSNTRITGAGTSTLSGIISGNFGLDFFEDTVIGTVSLSGDNTYTGTTIVNSMGSGTTFPNLIVSSNTALGTTAGGTTVFATGTTGNGSQLTLATGITVTDETLTLDATAAGYRASLITASNAIATWDGNVVLAGTGGLIGFQANGTTSNLTVGSSGTDTITGTNTLMLRGTGTGTVNSAINLGTGGIFKTDAGTWTITSNNNDFIGTPSIAGGIVSVGTIADSGANSALGAGTVISLGQNNAAAGTLQFTGAAGGSSNRALLIANGAAGAGVIENTVSGQTLTLSGNLTVTTPASACSLTLAGAGDGLLSGGITGAPLMALNKTGLGSWTLSGANTYTGATTVNGGSLQIDGSYAVAGSGTTSQLRVGNAASTNGSIVIGSGAGTVTFGGDGYTNAAQVGISGGTGALTINGGTVNLAGTTGTAATSLNIGVQVATAAGTGTVTLNNGTLNVGQRILMAANAVGSTGTLTIANGTANIGYNGTLGYTGQNPGMIQFGSGTGTLNLDGGTLKLYGFKSSTGAANINFNGGTLVALGSPTYFMGNNGAADTAPSATGSYNTVVKSGGAIIDTNTFNITIPTALVFDPASIGGGLTKNSSGTLTLTGANTYTGATTVNDGTLLVNSPGSLAAASAVAVNGTSTLGGNGTIDGSVTVADGANLAPGASAGTLTVTGNLGLSLPALGAGILTYELDALAGTNDKIVAGTVNIGVGALGFNDFVFTNLGGLQSGTYTLISSGGLTGTLDVGNLTGTIGGFKGDLRVSLSGNEIELVVSSAYDSWASLKGLTGLPGSSTDPAKGADPDGDGRVNLDEFAFDGDPLSGLNDGKIVGKVATVSAAQVMTLTLPVRTGATFSVATGDQLSALIDGIYYRIEGDETLSLFADAVTEVPAGAELTAIQAGLPGLSTGWTYRTFRAPGTVPTVPKAFLRAKVSETP